MTERGKKSLQIGAVTLLPIIFGAATAWATTQAKVSSLDDRLGRIEQRVTDIYCATIPKEQQRGCR